MAERGDRVTKQEVKLFEEILDRKLEPLHEKIDTVDRKVDRLIKHLGADAEMENLSRIERRVAGSTRQPIAAKSP